MITVNNGLYILTHGAYLTFHGDDLIVKKRKTVTHRYALHDIWVVFVQGFGITISVSLQLKLTELNIPVVMAAPAGAPIAVLNAVVSSKASLRVRQVLRRNDPDVISTGFNMTAAKVGNQAAVLRYFAKYRKKSDTRFCTELVRTAGEIREIASHIRLQDPCGASIRSMTMGAEGQAGAAYWRRIADLLPSELGFTGRKGRGAKDPVNQCLNYVYALLYSEVWCAVTRAGLDPYFGLMHGSQRDEGSLVFDLIEEFRSPFVDRLVFRMIGRGFQPEIGRNGMLKTGKRKQLLRGFIKGWTKPIPWRSKPMTPADILDFQTESLKKLFLREGAYHPFRMRW